MIATIRFIQGHGDAALYVRARDGGAPPRYWNFTTLAWDAVESSQCRIWLAEHPDPADLYESRYQSVSIRIPADTLVLEYVRVSDGVVIAEEDSSALNTLLLPLHVRIDHNEDSPTLEFASGDAFALDVATFQDNRVRVNLADAAIMASFKRYLSDPQPLVAKRNAAAGGAEQQIEMVDAAAGTFRVHILAADTRLLAPGTYLYDIVATFSNGASTVLGKGTVKVSRRVTS